MTKDQDPISPIGSAATQARNRRAARSEAYRMEWERLAPAREIAKQIIMYRSRHNLSQEQLAERIGTSNSQISRLESGTHVPTIETLRRIGDALDLRLVISFESKDGQAAGESETMQAGEPAAV